MSAVDGGPAFPGTDGFGDTNEGMTLRQYYQGQALAGLCARMGKERFYELKNGYKGGRTEATVASILAESMLAEDAGRES